MVYLMIIIVAAVAGITRLALQQRRESKFHLVDDFRSGLERLSIQPLPSQSRSSNGIAPRKRLGSRLMSLKRTASSPRGQWDRVAFAGEGSMDATADAFFGTSTETGGHMMQQMATAPAPVREETPVEPPAPRTRTRARREPLLAGRLWRKPREPWFWTNEKQTPRRPSRYEEEVEYVDFSAQEAHHVAEGNLARSAHDYGRRSRHASPSFTSSRGPARRAGLDPAKREAAKRRLEVRRRAGSRN